MVIFEKNCEKALKLYTLLKIPELWKFFRIHLEGEDSQNE